MSSIDSALNSLAAVTLEDVVGIAPDRQSVWLSRWTSLAWGVFSIISGLVFARSGSGVLETINQVGSAFYGPVLAVFVLGSFVLHSHMLLNIGWRQSMLQGIAYSAEWIAVGIVISLVYRA